MSKILIIDDERSILDTLSSILTDEGFIVSKAMDGKEGLTLFETEKPDIVLLDVWMPELDGIQVLRKIKTIDHNAIVIVISGHGTISTAVEAVKVGAYDFLEKPLSIEKVLEVIKRGLGTEYKRKDTTEKFKLQNTNGTKKLRQKTIAKSIVVYGVGLFSGVKTGMILLPMPENTGIVFEHIPDGERIPAYIDYAFSVGGFTSVKGKSCVVRTTEHLLSACHMYGITNLLIKVSEEVPIFDGSAIEICQKIDEAGIIDQDAGIEPLRITDKIALSNLPHGKSLCIEPSDKFEIDYVLEQTPPIGRQTYSFCGSKDAFVAEIAPARTFGFFKDFDQLTKLGLGSGARVNNVILLIDDGAVNTKLRFPDEFVRHKVLDLIGDTYLLNRPILGKITAEQTGHLEDIALVRELQKRYL